MAYCFFISSLDLLDILGPAQLLLETQRPTSANSSALSCLQAQENSGEHWWILSPSYSVFTRILPTLQSGWVWGLEESEWPKPIALWSVLGQAGTVPVWWPSGSSPRVQRKWCPLLLHRQPIPRIVPAGRCQQTCTPQKCRAGQGSPCLWLALDGEGSSVVFHSQHSQPKFIPFATSLASLLPFAPAVSPALLETRAICILLPPWSHLPLLQPAVTGGSLALPRLPSPHAQSCRRGCISIDPWGECSPHHSPSSSSHLCCRASQAGACTSSPRFALALGNGRSKTEGAEPCHWPVSAALPKILSSTAIRTFITNQTPLVLHWWVVELFSTMRSFVSFCKAAGGPPLCTRWSQAVYPQDVRAGAVPVHPQDATPQHGCKSAQGWLEDSLIKWGLFIEQTSHEITAVLLLQLF